jgi:predicted acetyltransferase
MQIPPSATPQAPPAVSLERAGPEDVVVLRRLMQLYLYDIGSLDGWDVGPDGLFGNAERIERFWTEPGRHAFLIRADGVLAGFALVRDEAWFAGAGTREVSEFFVLRRHRRRGVGERAARRLFDTFPGRWEVVQMVSNAPAQAFWLAVIGRCTGGRFEDDERAVESGRRRVQHFTAGHGGS